MDTLEGLLLATGWFLLRFSIPLAVTVLICRLFKRLDARWQLESETYRKDFGMEKFRPTVSCWLFNNCSEEKRANCKAYQNSKVPCWQQYRGINGELKEDCIGCGVFRGFPTPATGD